MNSLGYQLEEKSELYSCRPPKQLEAKIYLTFSRKIVKMKAQCDFHHKMTKNFTNKISQKKIQKNRLAVLQSLADIQPDLDAIGRLVAAGMFKLFFSFYSFL